MERQSEKKRRALAAATASEATASEAAAAQLASLEMKPSLPRARPAAEQGPTEEADGEALFALLQGKDEAVTLEDYFCAATSSWDVDGLRSDLALYVEHSASH